MKRGTFQLMKSVNKSLILNKIRTNQPISRAQIAKETRLTPPTVSSIVKELIEENLVIESNLGESRGGRKPTMLLINQDACYIIGVDAGPKLIHCVASDLSGKEISRAEPVIIQKQTSEEGFLSDLTTIIRSVIDTIPNIEKIMGIGVAMHGVVDVEAGISRVAPNLGLRDIPIREVLEKEFNVIVKVENDVRCMALGEYWFNNHSNVDSMLAVNMGNGVGAGLVIDGKLYHGAADLAGEVGHMTIDLNGDVCACGNRGCFQTFATSDALIKRAKTFLLHGNKPVEAEDTVQPQHQDTKDETPNMVQHDTQQTVTKGSRQIDKNFTVTDLYNMAEAGDPRARQILIETGEVIGVALTNLIHTINPDMIVLGGRVAKTENITLPIIKETIQKRVLTAGAKETRVETVTFGDDATLKGSIALLLIELFETA